VSKVVLIGQAPGKDGNPSVPLVGRPTRFLSKISGVKEEDILSATERMNVLDFFPGKNGKGDRFPMPEAREAAKAKALTLEGKRVVMLGMNVRKAFGVKTKLFEWGTVKVNGSVFHAGVIPHPSGINTLWNEEWVRRRARRFLRKVIGVKLP